MFDPSNLDAILSVEDADLSFLPSTEDERHEYKSGKTQDTALAEKIAKAASGFWNSGGGLFVAGVDGRGHADGGVTLNVGRQSRRDWIDQAISQVTPQASYVVHCIEDGGAGLNIAQGSGVFLIGFGASQVGPHMAPDNRYYIRAGAHTVSASHFIVEAIHARRGARVPILRHVVRYKPGSASTLQIGFVALGEVPAIDVSIRIEPLPEWLSGSSTDTFPIQVSVISEQFPFFFDFHILTIENSKLPTFQAELAYTDTVGRQYQQIIQIDTDRQLGPNLDFEVGLKDVERSLRNIESAIKHIAFAIQHFEK